MQQSEGVTAGTHVDLTGVRIPAAAGAAELAAALRAVLRGEVLVPETLEYEAARRVWNGVIDRRPALIARCRGAVDVREAVRFARAHGLPVSMRGGGHNVAGTAISEGGLVIDLSEMRDVRVDPERGTVRAGGGARLGDLDREAQAFGLVVPSGVVSRTGIAGLSLHGGLGFLTRRFGLTSDNLLSADVVTADGEIVTAHAGHHPDLFWALRGGGGNFGVVTSFEFRAHPVGPEVPFALVMYPAEQGGEVLRFFRRTMADAPDELMALAIYWSAAEEEHIPEEVRGRPVVVLAACHSGAPDAADAALRPFREAGTPLLDLSGTFPFVEAQQLFDPDYPDGRRYYWKSLYLDRLDEEAIAALGRHAAARPSQLSSLDVWALGGAFARVAPESTAFGRRDAPWLLGIEANWDDPAADAANMAWAREVFRDMQRFSPGGTYLNFPGFGEEGERQLRDSYGPNWERLRAVKARYDPDNFFRSNQNITPAT